MITLPTEQQVADLHEHLLARHGGSPGSRLGTSAGAVLGRVQRNLAYQLDEPTVAQVAAYVVYAFTVGHPFNDANKRTALALGDLVLRMNGHDVVANAHQIELADLIVELAAGDIDGNRFLAAYVELLERPD